MRPIFAVAVAGATASGKTALSIELARRLDGEIIICDSMQVYRGMDIGTAKPTAEELSMARHHLVGVCDASTRFSSSDYASLATAAARDITARGKMPIFCGGTGLYLDALLRADAPSELSPNYELRSSLMQRADSEEGREALHRELMCIDPNSAVAIHKNNVRRVVRALEIYYTSGITKTEWDRRSVCSSGDFDMLVFVLGYHNRETLNRRIEHRVDMMLAAGLLEETRELYAAGALDQGTTASQAIGYKELIDHIEGRESLAAAREKLIFATRRYAKRQETWFKSHRDFTRIYADNEEGEPRSLYEITEECIDHIRARLERKIP